MAAEDNPLPTPAEAGDNGNSTPPADAPPANAESAPAQLSVRFTNQRGDELTFKMKPHTKFLKAMDLFAARQGRARNMLRFLFEGERVIDTHSPQDLEMVDGDAIEVHEEQIGGGSRIV